MSVAAFVVAGWYGALSVVTVAYFGWDKRAAIRKQRRVPERTLHRLEWAGGWPGALVGMRVFRHKRSKPAYRRVLFAVVAVHLLAWGGVAWWIWGRGAFG